MFSLQIYFYKCTMLNTALVFIPIHFCCIKINGCRAEQCIGAPIASSSADHCKFYIFEVRFAYFDWQHHSCGFVCPFLSGSETQVQILHSEVRTLLCAFPVPLFIRTLAEASRKQTQIRAYSVVKKSSQVLAWLYSQPFNFKYKTEKSHI